MPTTGTYSQQGPLDLRPRTRHRMTDPEGRCSGLHQRDGRRQHRSDHLRGRARPRLRAQRSARTVTPSTSPPTPTRRTCWAAWRSSMSTTTGPQRTVRYRWLHLGHGQRRHRESNLHGRRDLTYSYGLTISPDGRSLYVATDSATVGSRPSRSTRARGEAATSCLVARAASTSTASRTERPGSAPRLPPWPTTDPRRQPGRALGVRRVLRRDAVTSFARETGPTCTGTSASTAYQTRSP